MSWHQLHVTCLFFLLFLLQTALLQGTATTLRLGFCDSNTPQCLTQPKLEPNKWEPAIVCSTNCRGVAFAQYLSWNTGRASQIHRKMTCRKNPAARSPWLSRGWQAGYCSCNCVSLVVEGTTWREEHYRLCPSRDN